MIATLRDAQSYVRSAETGLGIYEMPRWQVQQDLPEWQRLLSWLADRRRTQAAATRTPTDLVSIERTSSEPERPPVAPVASLLAVTARD